MSTYQIFDKAKGRRLDWRSYLSIRDAAAQRARLVQLAYGISEECGQDADRRADIRREV